MGTPRLRSGGLSREAPPTLAVPRRVATIDQQGRPAKDQRTTRKGLERRLCFGVINLERVYAKMARVGVGGAAIRTSSPELDIAIEDRTVFAGRASDPHALQLGETCQAVRNVQAHSSSTVSALEHSDAPSRGTPIRPPRRHRPCPALRASPLRCAARTRRAG